MTDTPKLALPLIAVSQAQKEVTHNMALVALDVLVMSRVLNATTTAPPGSPAEGDTYIVAATATGAWAGHEGEVAAYYSGWRFFEPAEGWQVWDEGANKRLQFDGAAWVAIAGAGGVLLAANGAVGAPGFAFASDDDTGIYRIGANDLGIATGGVLRLRINGSGQVQVLGGSLLLGGGSESIVSDSGYLTVTDNDGNARIIIGQDSGDRSLYLDLTTNDGSTKVRIRDSDDAVVFEVDSNGNVVATGTATFAPSAAQVPSLNSPWINYGSGFQGVRYFKSLDGQVTIEGLIQAPGGSDTTDVVLFTLLAGFRPAADLMFGPWDGGGGNRIDVQSNGDVVMRNGNTSFTSLSGIVFYAA